MIRLGDLLGWGNPIAGNHGKPRDALVDYINERLRSHGKTRTR